MKPPADYWINKLQLSRHVEGGSYYRSYCAALTIQQDQLPPAFLGPRPVSTAIYFLLEKHQFSAMHRIASDEVWHFYYGDPLVVYEIDIYGTLSRHLLGNNPEMQHQFQCVVKAGSWFGSKIAMGGDYALAGCTVAPGFDFDDFELAERSALLLQFPQHAATISMLTH